MQDNSSSNGKASQDAENFLKTAKKTMDITFKTQFVLPGDNVTEVVTRRSKKIKLGAGLIQQGDKVLAVNAGVLRYRPPNRFWVDFNYKRYKVAVGDCVIGIVEDRNADAYRVNIGASSVAILPTLSFDGATKRNRPNLQVGSLVYARVSEALDHVSPELTCEAPPNAPKKDWMTGEAMYGELVDGDVFKCSISMAKRYGISEATPRVCVPQVCVRLIKNDCAALNALAQYVPFELAVGANGLVWVNSGKLATTIIITNAILNAEDLSDGETYVMVDRLFKHMKQLEEENSDDE